MIGKPNPFSSRFWMAIGRFSFNSWVEYSGIVTKGASPKVGLNPSIIYELASSIYLLIRKWSRFIAVY